MKVFFLSGIGADYRAFTHTRLPDGFEPVHIPWIAPLPGERLPDYALRLFTPYHTGEPFCLIGLSLGGIVATEIAKAFHPVCTILISSVPVSSQLPPYYRWLKKFPIHRLTPSTLWKISATTKHSLTMKSRSDLRIMREMIWAGDNHFIRWGIGAVLNWNNEILPASLYYLHGTRDEVFPFRYTRPTHTLPKGGHMAVMNQADEVNRILASLLPPLAASQ